MDSSDARAGRGEHLWILAMAVAAIVGSFILQPAPGDRLDMPVPLLRAKIRLPETCLSRRVFGVSCPGCGLTRSFVAFAHGNLREALRFNAVGPILFLICVLQIPYRLVEHLELGRSRPWWTAMKKRAGVVSWFILTGLVIQWAAGLV